MIIEMKAILTTIFFFISFSTVAQAAFLYEPLSDFDVKKLTDIQNETIYGILDGAPHTFTFSVREKMTLSIQVSVSEKEEDKDVSLILVKQEKRGVSEVGRMSGKNSEWIKEYSPTLAVTFIEGSELVYALDAGVYKIEVSSPNNDRGYRLVLGKGKPSFFSEIFTARKVFGLSVFSSIFSSYIVSFLLIVFGFIGYRKYKKYVS